jgi:hypothetical protein
MSNAIVSLKTYTSGPIEVGNVRVFLTAQTLRIKAPFMPGPELIWNRPVSIRIQSDDMTAQVLPVVDITRLAQIMLLAGGCVGALIFAVKSHRHLQQTA